VNADVDVRVWPGPGLLALAILVALCTATAAHAGGEGDFDYWAKAGFLIPIKEDWRFRFDQKFSFTDEARRFDNHQQEYGVIYSGLADWLDLGFSVKQRFVRDGDDWDRETRPLLNVTVKSTLFGCGLSNRSRVAFRSREVDDDVWAFRHKITVKSPAKFTRWEIQPYVAEEIFIQFDDADFNGNRVTGGLYIPLHDKIRLDLFYAWQLFEDDGSWHDTNLLASFIRFAF
jgi:hypothetical protein